MFDSVCSYVHENWDTFQSIVNTAGQAVYVIAALACWGGGRALRVGYRLAKWGVLKVGSGCAKVYHTVQGGIQKRRDARLQALLTLVSQQVNTVLLRELGPPLPPLTTHPLPQAETSKLVNATPIQPTSQQNQPTIYVVGCNAPNSQR